MSSRRFSFTLFKNSGSAYWARHITTISTLSSSNAFSAISGVLIRPTPMVIIPVPLRILAALSILNPCGVSIDGTSYLIAAEEKFPLETFNTSTPASFAQLQNVMVSSMVIPFSR